MTIKSRIEDIAATLGLSFNYGTSYDFNINADSSLFPCIVLLEPDDLGFVATDKDNIYRKTTTFIQFLDLLPEGIGIAEQASARLPVIEAMSDKSAEFLMHIMADQYLTVNVAATGTTFNAVVLRDKYDAHACGIELQVPMSLVYPEDICV